MARPRGPASLPRTRHSRPGCAPATSTSSSGSRTCSREGSALRVAIESGEPHSAIFYGPPGTGKTTLARIIAARVEGAFEELSAVNAGRAEVREVIARAEERRTSGRPTIFFLDEIHRFNKAQQDALLPAVEEGLLTLIGATTENPYFEVNSALLSRAQIYEFRPLTDEEIEDLLRRALSDERGLPDAPAVQDEALQMLAARSGGDARVALAALERAVETTQAAGESEIPIGAVEDALQRKALLYDRTGDKHYDYISAWIKATRGSDVDASIYYLAVMLEGGEDPRFIARRMVIFASEDVGNADPAGPGDRQRRGAGGRSGRAAGVRPQPLPGRGLPCPGAEVERLDPRNLPRLSARPRAWRRRAATPSPGRPLSRRPQSSAAARATATRTTSPARSPTSRSPRRRCAASASTSRQTGASRPSSRAARAAARAAGQARDQR